MRLIHLAANEFKEFYEPGIPPYAILSHTWDADQEITLSDMKLLSSLPATSAMLPIEMRHELEGKSSYSKIKSFCDTAAKDGFTYGWIDTCCIDKTSSSELSEAINSMYRWYQRAKVCYAYLSDVISGINGGETTLRAFIESVWFTRGWTLQELIAPASVIFLNRHWEELGTKSSLSGIVSQVTGIQESMLLGADQVDSFSIAQRMSWASKRKTTRVEDQTYSLMGIFGVNMPMIYGEGERAFIRLQEEIIRNVDDHSILAWSHVDYRYETGLLAISPAAFANSADIVVDKFSTSMNIIRLTSKGICVEVDLARNHHSRLPFFKPRVPKTTTAGINEMYLAVLKCHDRKTPTRLFAICLLRHGNNIYRRHSLMQEGYDRCWMTVDNPFNFLPNPARDASVQDAYIPQKNRRETQAPHRDAWINIRGFGGAMDWTTDMFPPRTTDTWMDGMTWINIHDSDKVPSAIRFTAVHRPLSEGYDGVVLLEKQKGSGVGLLASIFTLSASEKLRNTISMRSEDLRALRTPHAGPADRVSLEYGHHRISVVIKRKIVGHDRALAVEISLYSV
jgi:hypothetical protein